MPSSGRRLAACIAVLAALACSNSAPAHPDPAALLRESASAMASVHSLRADVKFGPGLDYQGFTLASATTQISLPSASDTTIKVRQQDFLVDLRVVSVDGQTWVKVPFGKFTPITPDEAGAVPDLAALFDASHGLPALLAQGRSPGYVGTEKSGAVDCDKVTATYGADQVSALLAGLKPARDIHATLWLGRSDHRLYRALLAGPLVQAGQDTSVDIAIHDYDAPVVIAQPTP